jgi:hypothetical protein
MALVALELVLLLLDRKFLEQVVEAVEQVEKP